MSVEEIEVRLLRLPSKGAVAERLGVSHIKIRGGHLAAPFVRIM